MDCYSYDPYPGKRTELGQFEITHIFSCTHKKINK